MNGLPDNLLMTLAPPAAAPETTPPGVSSPSRESATYATEDGLDPEEVADPDQPITEPFNPERIRIVTKHLLVEQLVRRLVRNEINLAPDFQRNLVWNPVQKSRLIESLLLKIPLPVFYVASDRRDDWDVVDGIQRMSTIRDYVCGEFPLRRLEYLSFLEALPFPELPGRMQRRIRETELLVNVIEHGTPEEVMFNIFTRINTGGAPLNAQEIRHALHRGPARNFLKKLAASEAFQTATTGSVGGKRMQDRECVLRFLAFHMDPWEKYATSNLDAQLRRAMQRINEMSADRRARLEADFVKAMTAAHGIFGDRSFRKVRLGNGRRSPINRALFETWSVELARCSERDIETLVEHRRELQDEFSSLLVEDQDFERSISVATGARRRVKKRFGTVRNLIGKFLP